MGVINLVLVSEHGDKEPLGELLMVADRNWLLLHKQEVALGHVCKANLNALSKAEQECTITKVTASFVGEVQSV